MNQQDNNDFWAPWRVKTSLKDKAFDWLVDRALGFFYVMDGIAIWWRRKRKNAKQ